MDEINITSAQYVANPVNASVNDHISAVVDGKIQAVPLDPANRHYAEILRQVAAGTLTIQEAE